MWIFSILDASMTTLKISKASPIRQPKIKTVGTYLATCRKLIVTRESNVSLTADSSLGAIWNILLLQSFIKLTIFLSLSSGTACLLIYIYIRTIKREKSNLFCVWFIYLFSSGPRPDDVRFKNRAKIHCANVTELNVWSSISSSILICLIDKNLSGCSGIFS